MFRRAPRRRAAQAAATTLGPTAGNGWPWFLLSDLRDDGRLESAEGAVRAMVAARLVRDHPREVEACLAAERLGWAEAEAPARHLLDAVLRMLGRRRGPFDAARQLRLVATHLAGQFGVDPEVFEALAFQSFDEAAAGSGLRRDYLVVCVTALVSELLRAEGRRAVAGSA